MNHNRYANMVEATNDLTKKGFTANFEIKNGTMTCLESGTNYSSSDLKIISSHRFEGHSNPADNSIVYAVECNDGKKGMIVTAYGPYAEAATDDFLKDVKIVPQEDDLNVEEISEATSRK